MTSLYMTPLQVAEYLNVGRSTIYGWMKTGRLPFKNYGRYCKRIHIDDVRRVERDYHVGRPTERIQGVA